MGCFGVRVVCSGKMVLKCAGAQVNLSGRVTKLKLGGFYKEEEEVLTN